MNETTAERIGWLRARIAALDGERERLVAELAALTAVREAPPPVSAPEIEAHVVTNASSPEDKVRLFLSLFRGRTDVFPKRWENAKTGKSGYSPACANEWVRRLCGKPKVKCGECPDQAFVPMSDEVVRGHLQGRAGLSGALALGQWRPRLVVLLRAGGGVRGAPAGDGDADRDYGPLPRPRLPLL